VPSPRNRFRHPRRLSEPLITHRFALDHIVEAYDLFSNRRDGVLKVVVHP
jgi:threonine dehydrogenase-like Zn-dependent dehydrogenase